MSWSEVLLLLGFIAAWLLVQWVVLPRLGVPT
jgi:hypothetical protein